MNGYRDDKDAQRMRVASLEERLSELEAENEELRIREAEAETSLLAPDLTKDVEDTLASLKAMGRDLLLSEAEQAREQAAAQVRMPANPELVKLATMASENARPLASTTDAVLLAPRVERVGYPDAQESLISENAAYRRGLRLGVIRTLATMVLLYLLNQWVLHL